MPVFFSASALAASMQLPRDHAAIDDDDRELRRAVVEDEAAGVERVVGGGRLAVGHPAVDRDPGTSRA